MMMQKPSVILLGSKPASTVALELMLERGWNVIAVVPSGTHSFISGETLHDIAKKNDIPIFTQEELTNLRADFIISYMFRNRVTKQTLALANRAALNFHAGLLPEFAGWAFYNLAILEGADEYGCTCHHMDEGFDTGPICMTRKFSINPDQETAFTLERKSQEEMIILFKEFLLLAESEKNIPKYEQDVSRMRYLSKHEFEALKKIDPDSDAEAIQRVARAFFYPPYECAYIETASGRMEILPHIAKDHLAELLHQDDLSRLREVAGI